MKLIFLTALPEPAALAAGTGESRELTNKLTGKRHKERPAPGNPNPPEQDTTRTTDDHSRTKGNRPNRGHPGSRHTHPRANLTKRRRRERRRENSLRRKRNSRTRKPAKDNRTQDKEGDKHRREQGEPDERHRQAENPTSGHTGNPAPPQRRNTREKTDEKQHERNPQTQES